MHRAPLALEHHDDEEEQGVGDESEDGELHMFGKLTGDKCEHEGEARREADAVCEVQFILDLCDDEEAGEAE